MNLLEPFIVTSNLFNVMSFSNLRTKVKFLIGHNFNNKRNP